jgi:hypothetical protein
MADRWEVGWSHSGLWSLRQLPWRDAARVDEALLRFAATGEGRIAAVADDPTGARLLVPPFVVRLTLDPLSRRMTVWWIFRR